MTPLHHAAQNCNKEVVILLVDRGANIEFKAQVSLTRTTQLWEFLAPLLKDDLPFFVF
jgi:ankyrin repeat protein